MGDFNDEPWDESVGDVLGARLDTLDINENDLVNLMQAYQKDWDMGSNKYRDDWSVIDQIIVSGNLLDTSSNIHVSVDGARIVNPEFLLEEDFKYMGNKPYRMYTGYNYNGGYSDHLPVFIDIIIK